LIRSRTPADLDACVAVLRQVHDADAYPMNWPLDPVQWLCPPQLTGAWVAEEPDGRVIGDRLLRGDRLAAGRHHARGLVGPARRGGSPLPLRTGRVGCNDIFVADILPGMPDPLREPTFLILTALADAPRHGYGLIAEVDRLSDGRVALRPGTLYGALDRLADDGLVVRDREEIVDGRLRRYYRLTPDGETALRTETDRMRRHVEAATSRLRNRTAGAWS
jgi:PadR family transcriptional regulator PadR